MAKDKMLMTTTFQIPVTLRRQLKNMCLLTEKSMGEFIRIAIKDKIEQVKTKMVK